MRYAFGEVLIVAIGILFALQLNNWNSRNKEEEKTQLLIEQVYSAIKRDNDNFNSNIIFLEEQMKYCDILLNHSDSLTDQQLIEMLNYLDALPGNAIEADKIAGELNFENISQKHIQLVAQIKNFINGNIYKQNLSENNSVSGYVSPILLKNNITEMVSIFGYSPFYNFSQYSGSFSEYDLKTTRDLLNSHIFRGPVESVKIRISTDIERLRNIVRDGNYLLAEIKKEFPTLRLMFDNVGIIGTSLPSGYEKSVPMKLIDEYQSIWEIDIQLSEGSLKFRTRDSWTQNWGGYTFPNGYAQSFGKDIYVNQAGFYHVVLNLSDNTYEFIKKKE
jgi:hypothetical protein